MARSEEDRLNILLIADDTDSIQVTRQALEASNTHCRLLMVGVGPNTLAYLRREGPYADAPVPDLILFDIIDAEPDSIAVLKCIKAEPEYRSKPIVLLTNDESEHSVDDMQLGGKRYTTFSPVDLESFFGALNAIQPNRFMQAISLLENFGFVLVRMPAAAELEFMDDEANVAPQALRRAL